MKLRRNCLIKFDILPSLSHLTFALRRLQIPPFLHFRLYFFRSWKSIRYLKRYCRLTYSKSIVTRDITFGSFWNFVCFNINCVFGTRPFLLDFNVNADSMRFLFADIWLNFPLHCRVSQVLQDHTNLKIKILSE